MHDKLDGVRSLDLQQWAPKQKTLVEVTIAVVCEVRGQS